MMGHEIHGERNLVAFHLDLFFDAIKRRGLNVDTPVPIHGVVVTLDRLAAYRAL